MERITSWKEIELGDLGFYAGDGFLSESIEHLTHRDDLDGLPTPSHSLIILSKSQVFESVKYTRIRPLMLYEDDFKAGRMIVFRPPLSKDLRAEALSEMTIKYNNAIYGWGQILAFIPVLWWRRLTGNQGINVLPAGTVCSELSLILCRKYYDKADSTAARLLRWAYQLNKNTTDPALLMSCCIHDRLPVDLAG